jgi:hypothetical protein
MTQFGIHSGPQDCTIEDLVERFATEVIPQLAADATETPLA